MAFAKDRSDVLIDSAGSEFCLTASRLDLEGYSVLLREVSAFSVGVGMYVEDVMEYYE